jgi:hypothetical protein
MLNENHNADFGVVLQCSMVARNARFRGVMAEENVR